MIKKIIIGALIFFGLLMGALVFLPYLFRDKIEAMAKEEINKNVDATINWSRLGISVFKDFPNITVSLSDFSVINKGQFTGDTLAYISSLDVSLDIMTVIKGETYDLKGIHINSPKIRALKHANGNVNWNIMKTTTAKEPSKPEQETPYSIKLRIFKINNGDIVYKDDSTKTLLRLNNLNIHAKGDFSQDNFLLRSQTGIDALTVQAGNTTYLNEANVQLKADLDINQTTNTYTFKENELKINALTLGLDGFIKTHTDDSYEMDLKLNTKETEFKTILSLVPAIYKKDFKDLTADGKLTLNAFAKGTYKGEAYPAFGLNLDVNNARFKYPSVPTAVQNIFIDLKISNPGGSLDNTVIDLAKLSANVDNDPFLLKLKIKKPISDPDIDAAIKGRLNLSKIPSYYPSDDIKKISGILNADVTAKGRLSAIEQQRYQDFDARGNADLRAFNYESNDLPAPVSVASMQLTFNPQNVTVSNLDMKIGKSDIKADGALDNLMNYIFSNQTLKGRLTVNSNNIDLNEFMTANETPATEKTDEKDTVLIVKVPENIDFTLNGNFKRIVYDKIELKNVSGNLIIRDQTVRISNLSANLFDGSILINGMYATQKPGNPEIEFSYDLKNIRIQDAFTAFDLFQKYAPVLEKVNGRFTSKLNIKGKLSEDLSPDLKTLAGDGLLEMNNITISGIKVLNNIADKFKLNQLKNISIDKAWTVFKFKDGRMVVDPTDLRLNDLTMNLSGSHGLDNTLDYNILMDVPTRLLQGSISEVKNMVSQANIPGLSAVQLPENLKLKVNVSGMMNNPELKFSVAGIGTGSNIKDVAKEMLEQKKKELEEQAKAEAEKLKQQAQEEAEKKKKELEEKARAEQERLKKEAEKKAQEEKERMKKEAEKKLKDKVKFP